jgi:hypothetical protein
MFVDLINRAVDPSTLVEMYITYLAPYNPALLKMCVDLISDALVLLLHC